ncbi:MAG: hypothetical protein JJU20_08030 [Opitutales bacterium]|nr:hypothetical protein [Opitutales bacterium]
MMISASKSLGRSWALPALLLTFTLAASAQNPVLNYRLATATSAQDPAREANLVALGLHAEELTRGPGLEVAILSQSFAATGWNTGTEANELSEDQYWSFGAQTRADYRLHLERVEFQLVRNSSEAPASFELRLSRDGFASESMSLHSSSYTEHAPDAESGQHFSVDLPEGFVVEPGQTIEFRLYAWDAESAQAVAALGRSQGPKLIGRIHDVLPLQTRLSWAENGSTPSGNLQWSSRPGYRYGIQVSEDLNSWDQLDATKLLADSWSSSSELAFDADSQFYRVTQEGPEESPVNEIFYSIGGPTGTEEDLTLEDKVIELLELAVPGTKVRGALYTWSRSRMADAFIAAHNRGVDIELVIGSDFAAVSQLEAAMPGRIQRCLDSSNLASSCLGGGINHNKFFLFSELSDGSRDVVIQSSANFTNPQIVNHNVMLIFRNHAAMYDVFDSYWEDLNANVSMPNYNRQETLPTGDRIYFAPYFDGNGDTGAGDPVALRLEQMAEELGFQIAKAGNFFALIPPTQPVDMESVRIHVGMAFWTNARAAIARRLAALSQAGADIQVIMNPESAGENVISILLDASVDVSLLSTLHSKTMLLDYPVDGQRRQVSLTGSHNYTSPALRSNDEVLLELYDPAIHDSLLADWKSMSTHPLIQPQ